MRLSFLDVHISVKTLRKIVAQTYGKIPPETTFYTILGVLLAFLIMLKIFMCCIKRSVERDIKSTQNFVAIVNRETKTMHQAIINECKPPSIKFSLMQPPTLGSVSQIFRCLWFLAPICLQPLVLMYLQPLTLMCLRRLALTILIQNFKTDNGT